MMELGQWETLFEDYLLRFEKQMKQATLPLKRALAIPFFGYHRIDRQGKYCVLTDRPDWAGHYLERQFYLNDPYLEHPDAYSSGTYFFHHVGSESESSMIHAWKKSYKQARASS